MWSGSQTKIRRPNALKHPQNGQQHAQATGDARESCPCLCSTGLLAPAPWGSSVALWLLNACANEPGVHSLALRLCLRGRVFGRGRTTA